MQKNIQNVHDAIHSVIFFNFFSLDYRHDVSDVKQALQFTFVQSEVKETLDAMDEGDPKETLDGLCDVFVTAVYHEFISGGYHALGSPIDSMIAFAHESMNQEFIDDASSVGDVILNSVTRAHESSENIPYTEIMSMYSLFHQMQPSFNFGKAIEAVMVSNWTKFPKLKDIDDIDLEVNRIESEHGKTNVRGKVLKVEGDDDRVVFRDNFGNGKICKPPSHYISPDFSYESLVSFTRLLKQPCVVMNTEESMST